MVLKKSLNENMLQIVILISFFNCFICSPVPQSLDWRTKGAVLPVVDQGDCAQSSLINALDAVSAAQQIKTGQLIQLSKQQIYDCGGDLCPCAGGVDVAHIYDLIYDEYSLVHNQIDSEQSYPFTGKCYKKCNFKKSGAVTTFIGYYIASNTSSEHQLYGLISSGPVTVQVEVNDQFQMYTGGIFNDPKCTGAQLNYDLLLVGYGTENGVDYWIARNTWGPNWGENGYIRLIRDKNMCGIGNGFVQPIVA